MRLAGITARRAQAGSVYEAGALSREAKILLAEV